MVTCRICGLTPGGERTRPTGADVWTCLQCDQGMRAGEAIARAVACDRGELAGIVWWPVYVPTDARPGGQYEEAMSWDGR